MIVLTCGTYGNVLRFLPPLSISDDLLMRKASTFSPSYSATSTQVVAAPAGAPEFGDQAQDPVAVDQQR